MVERRSPARSSHLVPQSQHSLEGYLEEKQFPAVTNQQTLLEFHEKFAAAAKKLMKSKNCDYADDTDPFANFRRHGRFGILVRLDDKLLRLGNMLKKKKFEVSDESLHDTLIDVVNYAILFAAYSDKSEG